MAEQPPDLLAAMLEQYSAQPREPSLWERYGVLGTPAMEKRGPWMRQYLPETLANFLATMPLALGGFRPGGLTPPHAIPRGSTDPGITGGAPMPPAMLRELPADLQNVPARTDSSAGLVRRMEELDAKRYGPDYLPVSYPRYDYQVFGDKGRWMNDPLPRIRTEGDTGLAGIRASSNEIAASRGKSPPWQTTDPHVSGEFAISDTWRDVAKLPKPEPGYGAQPGLPQYPRIPSHWIPENNPARLTLRGPSGIADRATFTGETLGDILAQIARTELKPSDRVYLEMLARQKFGGSKGFDVLPGGKKD